MDTGHRTSHRCYTPQQTAATPKCMQAGSLSTPLRPSSTPPSAPFRPPFLPFTVLPTPQVGLRHHGDFAARIPRAEMDRLANRMLATAAKLDSDLKVMICGSYRRGLPDSGDIDVLISHSHYTEGSKGKNPLGKFVTALTPGVITDTLSKGNKKFQGVCRLDAKSPFRRLDIMVTTAEEYWPAISYFTGSGAFYMTHRSVCAGGGFIARVPDTVPPPPSHPPPISWCGGTSCWRGLGRVHAWFIGLSVCGRSSVWLNSLSTPLGNPPRDNPTCGCRIV